MIGTEWEELVSHFSFLPPLPTIFSLCFCQPRLTLLSHSSCSACLSSCPSPRMPNAQVEIKSQIWQCYKSYIEVGNKWKQVKLEHHDRALCPRPASHPHQFFLLLTMSYDCIAESPTSNDSNSAQSWQK